MKKALPRLKMSQHLAVARLPQETEKYFFDFKQYTIDATNKNYILTFNQANNYTDEYII